MKSTSLIVAVAAIGTSLLLGACVALPAATPEPTPAAEAAAVEATPTPLAEVAPVETGAIPVEALRNATYSGIYDQPITLTDGLYEGEPPAEGDLSRPIVEYIDGAELTGDLDGDGVDDAVVFLLERGGGSGAFTYVAAQLNRDGQPVDAGAVQDRGPDRGQIGGHRRRPGGAGHHHAGARRRRLLRHAQGAQDLRPAGRSTGRDHRGGRRPGEGLRRRSRRHELDPAGAQRRSAGTRRRRGDPQLPGRASVSGSGGCNSYTGSFSLDEVNPFVMTIGPLAATEQACPDPAGVAGNRLLRCAGEASASGRYVFGQLALYYSGRQVARAGCSSHRRLRLKPQR